MKSGFTLPLGKFLCVCLLWAGAAWAQESQAQERGGFGEVIYVPIYSSVFYQDGKRTLELAAMLSVHNVDLENSITLTKVDYYNTKGELVRKQLDAPLVLKPLQTKNFVIEKDDSSGGTGANFLVEWRSSEKTGNSPIVEALMISAGSGQGISFTSNGRVIKSYSSPAK